jgi:uncharacterized protein (DUF362 family)
MDRRKFLENAGRVAAGMGALYVAATVPGCGRSASDRPGIEEGPPAEISDIPAPQESEHIPAGLVVARGSDATAMLRAGMEAWGGWQALDMAGKKVLIKVNGAFANAPEKATTTSPLLVAEAVRQCLSAGASKVTVFDHILQDLVDQTFQANGIGPAAKGAGAEVVAYAVRKPGAARTVQVPGGVALPSAGIMEEIFQADLIINMPKVKHHGGAGLSLCMKNLIGVTQDMGKVHQIDLQRAIAEV